MTRHLKIFLISCAFFSSLAGVQAQELPGLSYHDDGNYAQELIALQKLIADFPQSLKNADAQLHINDINGARINHP